MKQRYRFILRIFILLLMLQCLGIGVITKTLAKGNSNRSDKAQYLKIYKLDHVKEHTILEWFSSVNWKQIAKKSDSQDDSQSNNEDNTTVFTFKVHASDELEYAFPVKRPGGLSPAAATEKNNILVDWGDGEISTIENYFYGRIHHYEKAGDYVVQVLSYDKMELYFQEDVQLVEVLSPLPNLNESDLNNLFFQCKNLEAVCEKLFVNNQETESFAGCFRECSALKDVPSNVFIGQNKVKSFSYCFSGCHSLMAVEQELFKDCINATAFNNCFENCKFTEVPERLFAHNESVQSFSGCFMSCNKLKKIPESLFDHNPNVADYAACFAACSEVEGVAPELWESHGSARGTSCYSGCLNLDNYEQVPQQWK